MNEDVLAEFAVYQRAKGLSARTIANREYMLAALSRAARKPLIEIEVVDMRRRLGRGVKTGSMTTERDAFVAFFKFAVKEDLRTDDPCERLDPIRRKKSVPRPYTQAQIDRLLSSGAYWRTRVMILLGVYQGLRAGTIARVHGRDVDLAENLLRVIAKGNKHAALPLHPLIREVALKMPRDGYWFPARGSNRGHIHSSSVSDLLTRAKKRAGIDDDALTGHSTRHTFGTELVEAGVDIRVVQELMMHESLASTQIYTRVSARKKDEGIRRLPARQLPTRSGRRAA
jgi:site-specific recombinase XerD